MKVAFLCTVLLLAGSASCSSVEANSISLPELNIPDWIADLVAQLPGSIQNIIDKLPEIIAAVPEILEKIQEIVAQIIDKIPEVIPIILDKLPEIIAQVPTLIERIVDAIKQIIEKIPEVIPIILEKIPEIIEAIPAIRDKFKDIYDKIREVLEDLDLPDWFPTLPDLEKPEWWPELPTLPEINRPVPGTPTSVEEFPGIVQIEVGTGPIWVQGCAGNVLTSLHILGAGRCFNGKNYDNRFRRVRAGSSTRYVGGSIVSIEQVVLHPEYFVVGSYENDIAIIRLQTNLILSSTIQQTSIVPQGFNVPSGFTVVTAGWGSTAQGKAIADRNLYQVDLTVVDSVQCSEIWNKIPIRAITNNRLCVGRPETGGRNSDIRDMGTPIYYQGILTGIASLGLPIGNQQFPVLATPIGLHSNWIIANAV